MQRSSKNASYLASLRARLTNQAIHPLFLIICCIFVSFASAHPVLEGGGKVEVTDLNRFSPSGSDSSLFTDLNPLDIGIEFKNRYEDPAMWGRRYREFTLGSVGAGVAIGDFDQDGLPDIYSVSKTGKNALFRQTESLSFLNVTEQAGVAGNLDCWSTGVTTVDINNDGYLDIYLCNFAAPNQLFINLGNGTFTESAAQYGIDISDASVMAAFSDYDRDGDLDLYLLTNILDYQQNPYGRPDYLFRNNGDLTFTDVTSSAGISGAAQGHSATWWDYNEDGWPDVYVANDFETPDRLYRNNGDGTFRDVISTTLPLIPYFSMGADLGDINNDGLSDFFVGDMAATSHEKEMIGIAEISRARLTNEREDSQFPMYMRNAFFLNAGSGHFNEIAYLNHLDASDWTWAVRFADLDNNGWNDLFITNGNVRNFMEADLLEKQNVAASLAARIRVYKEAPLFKERNLAFQNEGTLIFENASKKWGLDYFGISFGTAFSDLDRDGDLDIVVNNYEENLKIYRNESTQSGILLSLKGVSSNQYGIGTEIVLSSSQGEHTYQHTLARGILSSDEPIIHFGLPETDSSTSLTIKWPSGHIQILKSIEAEKLYTITEPSGPVSTPSQLSGGTAVVQFEEVSTALGLSHRDRERYTDEFEQQYLLPRRLSRQGPALAWKENENSKVLIIGGAAGQETTAYSLEQNQFKPIRVPENFANKHSETLGIAVFEDLVYFANGSVEGSYQDQIATFTTSENAASYLVGTTKNALLPSTSTSAIAAADFDGDGDLDLFVGSRSVPGRYPETPYSYLLENRNGTFIDVTESKAPGLRTIGMVNSAIWSDYDGNTTPDLILALDWGPVSLFKNLDGTLSNQTSESGLQSFTGWWNSISAADFNQDGLIDYAVGNVGLNTKYVASPEHPTTLFYGDFDGSGRTRIVEAQYTDGDENLYPIRPYSVLRYSFPNLSEKFDSFRNFAQASLAEIFSPQALEKALVKTANTLESGIFFNDGNAHFTFKPLPRLAQLAPIYGMVAQDLNGDGFTDIYGVQNSFAPEPSTGRFSGGLSILLLGDGKGTFSPVRPDHSGLIVKGDAKAAISTDLDEDGWCDIIVSQNNDRLLVFRNKGVENAHSLAISLNYNTANPHGIGAQVSLHYENGNTALAELTSHSGYLSQSSPKLFFGYKEKNPPSRVSIRWPDGIRSEHEIDLSQSTLVIQR